MLDHIYLEPNQVPSHLKGSYSGKQFKAIVCTEMTIPASAGLWDGGSRELYRGIDLNSGRDALFPGQSEAPWGKRAQCTITLQPGYAVVEHTIFCGKDMGLTFYLHPENAAKLLPAPQAELSDHEKMVLNATCSLKSSYAGKDRYQRTTDNLRWNRKPYPTREQWESAKQSLIGRGLLNKAGAVTTAGRNASR